jgi:hypothetical protein
MPINTPSTDPIPVPDHPRTGARVSTQFGLGTVRRVRRDDRDDFIYTIFMDDPTATTTGVLYARDCEVTWLRGDEHIRISAQETK